MSKYQVNKYGERIRDRFEHFTEFDDGVLDIDNDADTGLQPASGWRATKDGNFASPSTNSPGAINNFDTNTGGVRFETTGSGATGTSTAMSFVQPFLSLFLSEDGNWPDVEFEMRFHVDETVLPTSNFEFLIGLFENRNPVTTLDNPSGSSGTDRIALGFASNAEQIGTLESYITTNNELYGGASSTLVGSPSVKASTLHTFGLEIRSRVLRFFFDEKVVATYDVATQPIAATEYSAVRVNQGTRYYAGIMQRSTSSVKTSCEHAYVAGPRSSKLGLGD